mgnify:CR=1 FL=1
MNEQKVRELVGQLQDPFLHKTLEETGGIVGVSIKEEKQHVSVKIAIAKTNTPEQMTLQMKVVEVLKANAQDLADIFIVSQAYIAESAPAEVLNEYTEDGITVWVTKAEGEKCERCWKYRKLGEVAGHETVCTDCANAVG